MTKFKVDLHSHTSDFQHLIFNKPNKKEYIIKLLNKLFKQGDNLVIGLAEFNDDGRFSKFLKAVKELPKDYIVTKNLPIVSIKKSNKTIHFIRADEISTEKGHVLIVGNNEKIKSRNLKEILKKARKNKWIVIADHPLHEFGPAYFIVSRINDHPAISLKSKTILKNKKNIDALELSSYFPEDREKVKKFGKKHNIPVIAESDAHFLSEFFDSHFELENLDLTNITTFKKTFRKALRKNIKLFPGKHPFTAKYKHGFQVIFGTICMKLGLIKS